jgi:hypothetical protein
MTISFLTPISALVALVGAVALGVTLFGERRLAGLCRLLGLRPPTVRATLPVKAAIALLTVILAVAVAQPVAATQGAVRGRTDAEVFFVFDVTRSMSARASLATPSRLDRARSDALALRNDLPDLPVGVASLTDRLLPLLFPTLRTNSFLGVISRSLGIDKPPSELPWGNANGTRLVVLGDIATQNYFDPNVRHRVAVVFTDGETRPFNTAATAKELARAGVRVIFVHIWGAAERVFNPDGSANPFYTPDPTSSQTLRFVAAQLDARVFGEREMPATAAAVRAAVGTGKQGVRGHELRSRLLTPFVLLLAIFPLAFILWRRNLGRVAETAEPT